MPYVADKIRYGLKRCAYAPWTEDAQTHVQGFGTPVDLPGAVSITNAPAGENVTIYADDIPYFEANGNNGYEGSLELLMIPESFKIACLGMTKATNGMLYETAKDEFKPFALLFEFSGDQNQRRHVMWKCVASRGNVDGQTKGETIENATETINFKAFPYGDGLRTIGSCDDNTATVYDGWYTAVPTPETVPPT